MCIYVRNIMYFIIVVALSPGSLQFFNVTRRTLKRSGRDEATILVA